MALALVTNDDGIESPGLLAAAKAVGAVASVIVAAPLTPQSSMGRSFPRNEGVGRIQRRNPASFGQSCIEAFAIEGSPAQVVAYAMLELVRTPPGLCVSGINLGENVGGTINGSGTVGAAMEATNYGVQALAASVQCGPGRSPNSEDWEVASLITTRIAALLLEHRLPRRAELVNLNIPLGATAETAIRQTIPTRQPYYVFERGARVDFASPCDLRSRIVVDMQTLEPDSDVRALLDGVVSVSLLTTHLGVMEQWAPLDSLPQREVPEGGCRSLSAARGEDV